MPIWFAFGPDRLGSIGQKRAGWFLHIGFLPDQIHLAQSARSKLDPGWFCTILSGRLWKNRTESKSGKLVAGWFKSCQKLDPLIPAHQLAFRPDEFSQILARPSRLDPGRFCTVDPYLWKNGTEKDAVSRIWNIRSGPILAAHWPYLAVTKMLPDRIEHMYWEVYSYLDTLAWSAWDLAILSFVQYIFFEAGCYWGRGGSNVSWHVQFGGASLSFVRKRMWE